MTHILAENTETPNSALASLSSDCFKLSVNIVNLSKQDVLLCMNTFKIFSICGRVICLCDVSF